MQSNIWAERAAVVELAEWARDWERQNGKPWAFSDAQSAAHKPVSGQRRGWAWRALLGGLSTAARAARAVREAAPASHE